MVRFAYVGRIEASEFNRDCFITSQKFLVEVEVMLVFYFYKVV